MPSTKICGVYKITCKKNKKIYIGSSNDIFRRWIKHIYDMESDFVINKHFFADFKKYGVAEFTFEVLQVCDPHERKEIEQTLMELHQSKNKAIGYNIA